MGALHSSSGGSASTNQRSGDKRAAAGVTIGAGAASGGRGGLGKNKNPKSKGDGGSNNPYLFGGNITGSK